MSNVPGISKSKIRLKALRILVRGFSYSLIAGVLFSDIFGQAIVDRIPTNSIEPSYFYGLLGRIYPEAVLMLSPLALFIGIFLQLLWDDKAITERI